MAGRGRQRFAPMPLFAPGMKEATFMTKRAFHAQANTIQHWQLRDLISTAESQNEVFYVHCNQTLRYNTHTREATVVQELGYAPTSMTLGHGFLASGGQQGQLDVFDLGEGKSVFSSTVADNVNNALHVGQTNGGDKCLLVSNNDCTVKVYSLPTLTRLTSISFPVAINYSSLSPDGKYMACVGDSDTVYLYGIRGSDFEPVATFAEASDSGMCCAWNASSTAFASASQDGTVHVWDVRMRRVLAKLKAQLACRSVKFSCGAIDLLVYSEHESTCHVVDARTFDRHQVLQMTPTQMDISGISFCQDGSRLFIGTGEQGIVEYEIDSIGRRSFASGALI